MENFWVFVLFILGGCAHLQPIKLEVTETENGVTINSNVPSGRTLDLLQGLTQRETMSGALERGVPATIWDQGLPLAKVGGDKPFMYNNFPFYGAGGMAYAIDPLAAASSNAAEVAYGTQARAQVPIIQGVTQVAPEVEQLEQDVRAIQRWIGAQESTP